MKILDAMGRVFVKPATATDNKHGVTAPRVDIVDSTQNDFVTEVIEESKRRPVLVDFWAPWCGPCKQLTPILEREVTARNGTIKLVKIDIDSNKELAAQLQIRSIPAVFAFLAGAPVDGFMGVQPESQLKKFVDALISLAEKKLPDYAKPVADQDTMARFYEQAGKAIKEKDIGTAMSMYQSILSIDSNHHEALSGLARCYLLEGQVEQSEALLLGLADDIRKNNVAVRSILAAIGLAKDPEVESRDALSSLRLALEKDTNSAELHFRIGRILACSGETKEGFDHLLTSIGLEKSLDKKQAQPFTLRLIESTDPEQAARMRRRLSSTLFS